MSTEKKTWEVRTYVRHGYFVYQVNDMAQAIDHGETIARAGVYRHPIPGGVEFLKVEKVKVVGPDLESEYPDGFRRT